MRQRATPSALACRLGGDDQHRRHRSLTPVLLALLRCFSSVVLEDSRSIALPDELAASWQGCGGPSGPGQAALKLHVRWELKREELRGPSLTSGRTDDRSNPFKQDPLPARSLYVADLGYVDWTNVALRRDRGSYTLTRAPAHTVYWILAGQRLQLESVLPQQVGERKELWVRTGTHQKHLMRLLLLRVPAEVAERRRASLKTNAARRQKPLQQRAWKLADWTILLTVRLLSFPEALVLLRGRWQMELLYKLWKQDGQVDEWRTTSSWRVLCELYAKLIGLLFAWHDEQRSLVKLAKGWCVIPPVLSWKHWPVSAPCAPLCGPSG